MGKVKVSMTLHPETLEQFRQYCGANGMKISTKVEQMMREILKDSSLGEFKKERKEKR